MALSRVPPNPNRVRVFPANLMTSRVNSPDYETGYCKDNCVEVIDSDFMFCPICKGVPRSPIFLPECGHMFCDWCLNIDFYGLDKNQIRTSSSIGKACPLCSTYYTLAELKELMQCELWTIYVFKSIKVKCSNGCDIKPNCPLEMDEHESFRCDLRLLRCPNLGCQVEQPAYMLEAFHFKNCEFYHLYCTKCHLPVRECCMTQHVCFDHINCTLQSTKLLFDILM